MKILDSALAELLEGICSLAHSDNHHPHSRKRYKALKIMLFLVIIISIGLIVYFSFFN